MLHSELSSDFPRDSKQVQNARQRVAIKAQEDELATLLELPKEDKTVHNLQWTPSLRVLFYLEDQMDDILGDCCSAESKSISSIDASFNHLEKMGKFENSGLSEFLRGSWSNAGQILNLEGIVPFPNTKDKRLVISLNRPISPTFEVKANTLTCSECPRYNDRGI